MKFELSEYNKKLVMRMMEKCEIEYTHELLTPCWTWKGANTGHTNQGSYGKVSVHGNKELTHRVMWSCYNGFLGVKQLDHICCNTLCCNPYHLEPVTCRQNQIRKHKAMDKIIRRKYN